MKYIVRVLHRDDGAAIVLNDGVVIAVNDHAISIYENEEHYYTDPAHPREITPRQGIYGRRLNGTGSR